MRHGFHLFFRVLPLLAGALMALPGCERQKAPPTSSSATASSSSSDTQSTLAFFNPRKEESWTYKVTREVPVRAKLNDAEAMRIVQKHAHYYELIFERKRVCRGRVPVEDVAEKLILIDLFEDGELAEREYYEINSQGLFGRGWANNTDSTPIISSHGIPIAIPGMEGGKTWRTAVQDSPRQFKFRVIDRSTIELPAGTFEVAQVQITSGNGLESLKRTLWFAENVGIVKEITTYYDATSIRVREISELIDWQLPNTAKAKKKSLTPPTTEAASTGPSAPANNRDEL